MDILWQVITKMSSEQGLADTFILLGMPFDSAEAKQLNKEIFETIYFAALEKSYLLAKHDGLPMHCLDQL